MVVSEPKVLRGTISGYGYGSGYGDGDGDGYGSGYGDGDGDGYGSGYGDGDGDGYGYGSGYGDGSGYGYGYGYGSGYGDGSGYGYGSGDGDGSGYGDGYWKAVLGAYRDLAPRSTIAFWKSNADGSPANDGTGTSAKIGLVEELPGPLRDTCGKGQLHATFNPQKWKGERLWVVAMHGEVKHNEEDDKMWCLKREILAEIKGVL